MTISDYQAWKRSGSPFDKGAELYQKHGDSNALKSLFSLGENEFSREKLQRALEGLAGKQENKPTPIPEPVKSHPFSNP